MTDRISVREAARLARVSTGTINYWAARGRLDRDAGRVSFRAVLDLAAGRRGPRRPATPKPPGRRGAISPRQRPLLPPSGASDTEPPEVMLPYQAELPETHAAAAFRLSASRPRRATAPLVEAYLAELADGGEHSPRTIEAYRQDLYAFARDAPDLPVDRMTVSRHLGRLRTAIDEGGNQRLRLKATSVHRHFRSICAFLHWAHEVHDIPLPVLRRLLKKPKEDDPVYLDAAECRVLLAAAASERDRLMLRLLLSTGMRASELCSITPAAVRRDSVRTQGKGGKVNHYPLRPDLRQAMHALTPPGAERVFMGPKRPVSRGTVYKVVSAAMERAGIAKEKRGPHVLRHTAGVLSNNSSGNIRYVQELLHHSSIVITQRYTHVDAANVRAMHARWDPLALVEGEEQRESA